MEQDRAALKRLGAISAHVEIEYNRRLYELTYSKTTGENGRRATLPNSSLSLASLGFAAL
jgi:hypothetical protein